MANDKQAKASLDQIRNLYSDFSEHLHGSGRSYMKLKRCVDELIYQDAVSLDDIAKSIKKVAQNIIYVLMIFHRKNYEQFKVEHQSVFLDCLSPNLKRLYHQISA